MPVEPGTEPSDAIVILCTIDDGAAASRLAHGLVGERLAACVHCLPPGRSVYHWRGRIEEAREHTLLIKSVAGRYPEIERWILRNHPYDTPEIIALPVSAGLPEYLEWITQCTQ